MNNGQPYHLQFTKDGIGHLASLSWKNDRFSVDVEKVFFAAGNRRNFVSLKSENNEYYYFAQYRHDDDTIIIWEPNIKAFERAVKAGYLQGNVSEDVHLTSKPENILKFSDDDSKLDLFVYERPALVFKKLSRQEKPKKE